MVNPNPNPATDAAAAAATDAPPAPALELRAGALRLALRPDLGGSIAGLWHHGAHGDAPDPAAAAGLPVMRSTEPAALDSARASACYPLVPYSNRLGYRRFRWLGRDHTTARNVADDMPHSLHGVAWQRPWTVVERSATTAVLRYVHEADEHWPFAFEAVQRFALEAGALAVSLAVTNRAPTPQPVGLGWHPYFPKRTRSRLHAEVDARWDNDATGLPVRAVAQPGLDGDVGHMGFDNGFDGWRGAARLRDERLSLRLTSSLGRLVVFTPPTKPYFCVEPVSHVSNAIHMADPLAAGLRSVAPGETTEAWMRLEVERA